MLIPDQARSRRGNFKPKIRLCDAEVLIERWVECGFDWSRRCTTLLRSLPYSRAASISIAVSEADP